MEILDAITAVIDNYSKVRTEVDIPKVINDCMVYFKKIDLPYTKIYESKEAKNTIIFEVPFLDSLEIKIQASAEMDSNKKLAILVINGREIRKVQLQSLEPKYMVRVVEVLLDYLKRYTILRNKFVSK